MFSVTLSLPHHPTLFLITFFFLLLPLFCSLFHSLSIEVFSVNYRINQPSLETLADYQHCLNIHARERSGGDGREGRGKGASVKQEIRAFVALPSGTSTNSFPCSPYWIFLSNTALAGCTSFRCCPRKTTYICARAGGWMPDCFFGSFVWHFAYQASSNLSTTVMSTKLSSISWKVCELMSSSWQKQKSLSLIRGSKILAIKHSTPPSSVLAAEKGWLDKNSLGLSSRSHGSLLTSSWISLISVLLFTRWTCKTERWPLA